MIAPPQSVDDGGAIQMSAAVRAKFDALPSEVREMFATAQPTIPNALAYFRLRLTELKTHGFTLDEIITVAE
jgi:hypothetical protein